MIYTYAIHKVGDELRILESNGITTVLSIPDTLLELIPPNNIKLSALGQSIVIALDQSILIDDGAAEFDYTGSPVHTINQAFYNLLIPAPDSVSSGDTATEAKQDAGNASLAAMDSKLTTLNTKDFSTQTTLAALLAKVIAAPSTEDKQDSMIVLLALLNGYVDGLEGALSTLNAKDFSTQTTLAAVLAKLSADPATQTTLAAILAKIIAAPSTEAKQDTGNTSLSSIDTKTPALGQALAAASTPVVLTAAQVSTLTPPAAISGFNLEATQLLVKAKTDNLDIAISALRDALRGVNSKTFSDLVTVLGSPFQAGASIGNTSFQATQATAANLNMTEASAAAIKTAVETIDNFISGARGLVTEDNSAAILAVEGAITDTIVAAGATGSMSAKLRRVTQGLEDLKTTIVLAAGTNRLGLIRLVDSTDADLTSAKNSQTARFIGIQQSINAGRNARNFMLDAYTAAPLVEAVQSVVQWYNNAAVAGTSQPAVVPAGKTLRLTHYTISTKSLATVGSVVVRIRANTSGLGVLGSPLVFSMECGSKSGATTIAMTGGMGSFSGVFPEGLEFNAGTGLSFSMAGYGPIGLLALQGVTRFQIFGYEY